MGSHLKIMIQLLKVHTVKALENLSDEQLERLGFKLGDIGNVKAALVETYKDSGKKEICRLVEAIKRKPADAPSNEDKSSSKVIYLNKESRPLI